MLKLKEFELVRRELTKFLLHKEKSLVFTGVSFIEDVEKALRKNRKCFFLNGKELIEITNLSEVKHLLFELDKDTEYFYVNSDRLYYDNRFGWLKENSECYEAIVLNLEEFIEFLRSLTTDCVEIRDVLYSLFNEVDLYVYYDYIIDNKIFNYIEFENFLRSLILKD
jgi:hypothetical protein